MAVGEILYRERRLELRFLLRFYVVGSAVAGLSASLILLGAPLFGILGLIGIAGLMIEASLTVSQTALISTQGLALPMSVWDQIAYLRRRWVPREAIARISPLVALKADGPGIYSYEIEYAGEVGLFRVQELPESYLGHPPLIALERMMGDRWTAVFRKIPPLTPARVTWLEHQLRGPHLDKERKNRLAKTLILAGTGASGIGGFLSFATDFAPGVYLAIAAVGISFATGIRAISKISDSTAEQVRAYWFLAQILGAERDSRAQSLSAIRVHPDFACIDPRTPERDCEPPYLLSELRRWRDPWISILSGFSIFLVSLFVSSNWLDLPLLATLETWVLGGVVGFVVAREGWKDLGQVWGAKGRLLEILAEEWRTGSVLLPQNFEIPGPVGLFRNPGTVTESMLRRMRLAGRIDSSRLVLVAAPGGLVVLFPMFFLADIVLRNHSLATLSFVAVIGWAAAWFGVAVATSRGRSLLACAKAYEEATGRTVPEHSMESSTHPC